MKVFMQFRAFLKALVGSLAGTDLQRTLRRNARAADQLDRAVREMLRK